RGGRAPQRDHEGRCAPVQLDVRGRPPQGVPRPGICASFSDAPWSQARQVPLPPKGDGHWGPYKPSEWKPYPHRQRWFRTPNDAFLTGNFHVSQSLLQNVLKTKTFSWVQLLLASIYSGAFHPTAEGQAAIADAVVDQARSVVAKYESRRRAASSGNL